MSTIQEMYRLCVCCDAAAKKSGARFGVSGRLCERCYQRLYHRHVTGSKLHPDEPSWRDVPMPPCSACGTMGGVRSRTGRPIRHRGERIGTTGRLCHSCFDRLARYHAACRPPA